MGMYERNMEKWEAKKRAKLGDKEFVRKNRNYDRTVVSNIVVSFLNTPLFSIMAALKLNSHDTTWGIILLIYACCWMALGIVWVFRLPWAEQKSREWTMEYGRLRAQEYGDNKPLTWCEYVKGNDD